MNTLELVNPRFIAYAQANGRTPRAQMEHDTREYPGGCMAGYILWVQEHARHFRTIKGHPMATMLWRDEFTDYLQQQAKEQHAKTQTQNA